MRSRTFVAGFLIAAVACDDPTPRTTTGDSSSVVAPWDAADSANILPAPPSLLATACVAGDPDQGAPLSLSATSAPALTVVPIEALATRDSARLAARISRTVDVLPSDTSVADFHGLPVSVRDAWLVVPAPGDSIVVALVVRRMPMESEPLEEVFSIVAASGERPGVRDPLVEAWVARDVGKEDELAIRELVGAYAADDGLALVLIHDDARGRRAELLTRRAAHWRLTWSGALPACAR